MSKNRVFIAVFDHTNDQLLLGKRGANCKNAGQWGLFGGKIDAGESANQAAQRELEEETGVRLTLGELAAFTTDVFYASRKSRSYTIIQIDKRKLDLFDRYTTAEVEEYACVQSTLYTSTPAPKRLHKSATLYFNLKSQLSETLGDQDD